MPFTRILLRQPVPVDAAIDATIAAYANQAPDVHRFVNIGPTLLLRSVESTPQMSDLFKT